MVIKSPANREGTELHASRFNAYTLARTAQKMIGITCISAIFDDCFLMNLGIDQWAERVQHDVISCQNDQEYDNGVVCWRVGSPTYIEDLLIAHKVPKRFWKDVVDHVKCPACGGRIRIWEKVGIKPGEEIRYEQQIEKALNRYEEQLAEFTTSLTNYPYLGALHPVGKRIVKEINSLGRSTLRCQSWFRARRVESPVPMTVDDLRPPDPQKHPISEGRFNHFGQACWYLTGDCRVAAAEVTSSAERLVWVQEWKIERLENVLDLRAWHAGDDRAFDHEGQQFEFALLPVALVFGDHLNKKPDKNRCLKPEYLVPRFVADAAKHNGFSGILFRSTRGFGENLVLFDARAPLLPIGKPKLVCLDDKDTERRDGLFFYQGFPISVADIPDIGGL